MFVGLLVRACGRRWGRDASAVALLAAGVLVAVPAVGEADTLTFSVVGSTTWIVPMNVTSATITAIGGSGGSDRATGSSCTPAYAAVASGPSTLTPGDTVTIGVGGKGGDAAGATGGAAGTGGGGAGGTVATGGSSAGGGGGGGQSVVSAPGTGLIVHAAGGGGCGGFGGSSGGNGGNQSYNGAAGSGGTAGAAGGGAGGTPSGAAGGANVPADSNHGGTGSASGQAGAGFGSSAFVAGGGGGGGGYAGGGGGGAAAGGDGSGGGGGGGEASAGTGNFQETLAWTLGTASSLGDGSVTITYTPHPAPDASTGAASSVTDATASLAGTVNPQGIATQYRFQYGPSTSYGQQTPAASAGNGSAAVPASGSPTGLAPGTIYHYRLAATNASGSTYGADQTLETTGPPSVNTGVPSAVTDTTATLAGSLDPHGHGTTYHFEYGSTTSYGQQTADSSAGSGFSAQQVTGQLANVAPGTVFHYRLVASNASGTTNGADQQLQTTGEPQAVTGAASSIGSTSATLAGTVNPQGHQTSYQFDYGTTTSYGQQTPLVAAGSDFSQQAVSQQLANLTPGTVYHYRLTASNASGSRTGADATFATPSASPPRPGPTPSASPPRPPGPTAILSLLGKPKVLRNGVSSYTLLCEVAACHAKVTLTTLVKTSRGHLVAVMSAARRARTVATLVGSQTEVIPAGAKRTLTISLNAAGRRLRARFVRLPAKVALWLLPAEGPAQLVNTRQIRFPPPRRL